MDVNKFQPIIRQIFIELSERMPEAMTFREIANIFFKYGIINSPDNPYGSYQGTKRDYVLDKLNNADNILSFMDGGIAELTEMSSIGIDGAIKDTSLRTILKQLGYTKKISNEEHGIDYMEVPTDIESKLNLSATGTTRIERISRERLPNNIATLIDELNDNLSRGNLNASALLIRRILTLASTVALLKHGGNDKVTTQDGESFELNVLISNAQQEFRISSQTISRVRSAKWIGDSANHSYRVKVNEQDLGTSVTATRLYIDELDLRDAES
ncbi:hypothetical protein CVV43_05335 [Candidatus Saccharibacteria bacterium HGW-Saccharibacteria-1]|jgi:hypothetical protein|nr:MAG: hypothetical protein CVV43_05335 [Candidatus Saccharibacteria bacterium HGW-Saccharibacteria-1]